jgi:soluble lytic murein transglycosylase
VLATAAYNAGPGRPRRWREGAVVEAAAWVEGIPFNETRDYVKKVVANAIVYTAVLGAPQLPPLKTRLGAPIGPREPGAPAPDRDLP